MSVESTHIIGREQHLVATLSRVAARTSLSPKLAVVLSNSGVIPRVGPHRINVSLARQFAALGVPSIRFDMSGLGDSMRTSSTSSMMDQWVDDARDAMDFAHAQLGCTQFLMIGFCSGAEVAYKTALKDSRMVGAVLWDLYAYPTLQSQIRALIFRARRAGLGGLVAKALARIGLKPSASASRTRVQTFEPSKIPEPHEYAADLKHLAQRGTAILVLYCGGEPQWYNYRGQFDATLGRLGLRGLVDFDFLEQTDHLLTRHAAQQLFIQTVVRWMQSTQLIGSSV